MLTQQLRDELKKSMIARDELKTSVLRMLISAITYYEINKGGAGYEATDEDVMAVIHKEVKQRRDSIQQYEIGKRQDLADREKKELTLLEVYLPKQLSEDEIRDFVKEAISNSGAKTQAEIGKVMGLLMPKVKDKADGNTVSKIVKEELGH